MNSLSVSLLGSPALGLVFQLCLTKVQQRGRIISLDWLKTVCLLQPRMTFAFPSLLQGTLLAHAQLGVQQNHFWKAVFQLFGPQLLLVHAVVPPSVQHFVVPLPELHKAPVRFLDKLFTTRSKLEPSSLATFQYTPLAT